MKPKNKKILALLCLPVLMMSMILPLCSFTTTQSEDYVRYSSRSDIQFSYMYNRGGQSSYAFYRGVVPDSQQILVASDAISSTAMKDSIKFYACDLYMGDTNKSIDMMSFSTSSTVGTQLKSYLFNTDYSGSEPTYNLGLAYKSDNIQYSWFDLDFMIYDYHHNDDIYIELWGHDFQPLEFSVSGISSSPIEGYYLKYISGVIDVSVAVYQPDVPGFEYVTLSYEGNVYDLLSFHIMNPRDLDILYLDVSQIVYCILDNEDFDILDLGSDYLISSVHLDLDFDNPLVAPYTDYPIGGIRINSNIIRKDNVDSGYFDTIIQFLGDGRYNDGYNAGISNASSVWSSLGTFLTKTVGAFINAPLWSNFTIGTLLSVVVGALLMIMFLKMFAGG